MVIRSLLFPLVLWVALAGLAATPSSAEDAGPVPEGWAYELTAELMSPFCPGRTLADCPSSAAKSLVMWVIVQESAGRTRGDVEQELYERYGDEIRPAPKAQGFGLTAYLIPVGVFAAGGALVFVFLRRQTREAAAAATAAPGPIDPELERIVDRELAG